jgi:DNA-binding HxlR family transcriptional regulator
MAFKNQLQMYSSETKAKKNNHLGSFSEVKQCPVRYVLAVNDTLNVISGKWKLPIIASLIHGRKRFKELERSIERITPRMLSKELKELELNGVVKRMVHNTRPVLITYELTESGYRLVDVIDAIIQWGLTHRQTCMPE